MGFLDPAGQIQWWLGSGGVAVVNGEGQMEFWVYFESVGDDGLNWGWEKEESRKIARSEPPENEDTMN